jgi:hypothetical protein
MFKAHNSPRVISSMTPPQAEVRLEQGAPLTRGLFGRHGEGHQNVGLLTNSNVLQLPWGETDAQQGQ